MRICWKSSQENPFTKVTQRPPPQFVKSQEAWGTEEGEQKCTNIHGSLTGMRAR